MHNWVKVNSHQDRNKKSMKQKKEKSPITISFYVTSVPNVRLRLMTRDQESHAPQSEPGRGPDSCNHLQNKIKSTGRAGRILRGAKLLRVM